ncbi:hypothetical protein [Empedobacter sedimenti]|uniref:hypothetical protein n=1 Tax=Empedobacter sedimenti TaxID=3042610 RepID=UPI0024A6DB12|nr:hypothetical protein [Empedobacter sedimenti]
MKKIICVFIVLITLISLFVIAKYKLFTDNNLKFYEDGWTAYENEQYDLTIFYLSHVDKNKYPDVVAPIGFSYFEKKDFPNALINLQDAYNKKIGIKEGYSDKISNTLGIIYMEKGEFDKSKFYFTDALNSNNPDSKRNLQILDSLKHVTK